MVIVNYVVNINSTVTVLDNNVINDMVFHLRM